MDPTAQQTLQQFGFRLALNGAHAARTLMLGDLAQLLLELPDTAPRADYAEAVVEANRLGKPTRKARELAWRHLSMLYGFDPQLTLFRLLRQLWPRREAARPMLAYLIALARDPLLRLGQPYLLAQPVGALLPREAFEAELAARAPDRFSPATLKSLAQNLAGSWTVAGFATGRSRKHRSRPPSSPEALTLALLLGFLEGRRGNSLLRSPWTAALDQPESALTADLQRAAGSLLVLRQVGEVLEIRFPDWLSDEDVRRSEESDRVF